MATSAFAGITRRTLPLLVLRRCLNAASAPTASSSRPLSELRVSAGGSYKWLPAVVALPDGESAESSSNVKFLLGIFGGVGLAAVGLQSLGEVAVVCDGSELQKTTPDDIEKSAVVAKNYNILPDSYRRQVFFNYERRIRLRSSPEKVFHYFASHKDSQQYMTPADLMRAVVPIFPPSGSKILREGHLAGERPPGELSCAPSKFFMLFDTNGDGLISFAEYIFFVTLLSIPEEYFKTAFKMFDLDGDGLIDRAEFKEVMRMMRERTRQGLAEPRRYTGLKLTTSVENCGLVEFFFGKDGQKQLRYDDFEEFLHHLHKEIIRLEFAHYDFKQKGTISAYDFGLSMIAAADMDLLNDYLGRANALMKNPYYKDLRISPEEFYQFAELRKKLPRLALAMSSYGPLNRADFQRATSQVCDVPLSDAVVDVVFQIFDFNRDGYLSSEEFLHAMERREHDIANPKETGIVRFFKCWWRCGQGCRTVVAK